MSNFVINKEVLNTIAVTVTENSRLIDPYNLIQFSSAFNTDVVRVVAVDNITTNPDRYDLFEITETTSPDNSNGEVFLEEGQWEYKVYESATPTVNVDDTTERVLEIGMCIVK